MKTWVMMFLLAQITSSCIAPKNLTKHKAITREFLASLKPGKRYLFELKIGIKQVVKIGQVKGDRFTAQIYGKNTEGEKVWSDYSETFENLQKNVAKISIYKVNPYWTIVAITMGVVITGGLGTLSASETSISPQ